MLLELLTGLQERIEGREGQFIFTRPDGKPLDSDRLRRLVLYPALDEAGIERRSRENGLHALRHTAGSLLYLMTRDLEPNGPKAPVGRLL